MDDMRATVLVVDDDPALAEMLTIVLRGEGFDAAVVRDGARAMTAFRDVKPDLVLLDLMLPGMSGLDVCKEIRSESGVPIIMLTAKTDTVDVVLGLESGADDYVMKPFKPKELTARIRARLRRGGRRLVGTPPGRRRRDRCPRSPGEPGRRADLPHPAGVRPAGRAGPQAPAGVHPRGAARAGVGLSTRRRHPVGQRPRPAPAVEDREDPERPEVVVTVRGVGYKAGVS